MKRAAEINEEFNARMKVILDDATQHLLILHLLAHMKFPCHVKNVHL